MANDLTHDGCPPSNPVPIPDVPTPEDSPEPTTPVSDTETPEVTPDPVAEPDPDSTVAYVDRYWGNRLPGGNVEMN